MSCAPPAVFRAQPAPEATCRWAVLPGWGQTPQHLLLGREDGLLFTLGTAIKKTGAVPTWRAPGGCPSVHPPQLLGIESQEGVGEAGRGPWSPPHKLWARAGHRGLALRVGTPGRTLGSSSHPQRGWARRCAWSGESAMDLGLGPQASQGSQAFSWCHWATGCRGRAIMSFQCLTSPGPLFQDR